MRGLVLGVVILLGSGMADAKPCPKGTSRIGKKCVIDRWPTSPAPIAPKHLPPPNITLAVLHQPVKLDVKVTVDARPTAGALYHAAQFYWQAGDNTRALELYQQYLVVAPTGPAAPAVRAQIEKLSSDVPQ